MIKNEGSFWRDMRYVGVPGMDNLNQIGPGIVADFPKLAASAAHVTGRPLVWEEEGGGTGPNGKVHRGLPARPRHQLHEHPRPQQQPPARPSAGMSAARNTCWRLAGRRRKSRCCTRRTACGWATRKPTTTRSSW
jgi:hypothetical protein